MLWNFCFVCCTQLTVYHGSWCLLDSFLCRWQIEKKCPLHTWIAEVDLFHMKTVAKIPLLFMSFRFRIPKWRQLWPWCWWTFCRYSLFFLTSLAYMNLDIDLFSLQSRRALTDYKGMHHFWLSKYTFMSVSIKIGIILMFVMPSLFA
jgi:hypothetical protein